MKNRRISLLVPFVLAIVMMVPLSPRSTPPAAATWYYSHDGVIVTDITGVIVFYSFQIDANGNVGRNYMTTEQHHAYVWAGLGFHVVSLEIHFGSDVYDYVFSGPMVPQWPGETYSLYKTYYVRCGGCYTTMDVGVAFGGLPPVYYHLECGVGVG